MLQSTSIAKPYDSMAHSSAPGSISARYWRATRGGVRAEARAALERARSIAPDDPRVKANLEELDAMTSHGSH